VWLVAALLTAAAVFVLAFVYDFGHTRFFTIDEYQWGHATWLVSQGEIPYRDFYEHHLPLGYILHAPLLGGDAGIVQKALLLRTIAFAYILGAALLVGCASWRTNRDPYEALLSVTIPVSLGFGLMSAIDYRGDNWSAFTLIACLALIELNQRIGKAWLAALAGLLFACSVLMTQKILILSGFVIVLMLLPSLWRELRASPPGWTARFEAQRIPYPLHFCGAAAVPILGLLAAGAAAGVLGTAFEINYVQALEHERLYPGFSLWQYLGPSVDWAPLGTAVVVLGAIAYVVGGRGGFWVLPLLAALVGGLFIKAPYPYNFVLATWLVGICAVRAFCGGLRGLGRARPLLARWLPALYLLPLLIVPRQLGFVEVTTSNAHQLEVLRRIEAHSDPDEVVIDSAGGALFRPHRGYYWYQGQAHVKMFADYFTNDFVADLRDSEALFLIRSIRFQQLPVDARRYLASHYIRFHGELNVLGFTTNDTANGAPLDNSIDIVRAGDYYVSVHPLSPADLAAERDAPWREDVRIDGRPIEGDRMWLDKGVHRVSVEPGAPAYRFSFLPPSAFGDIELGPSHSPLFEFEREAMIEE
jgi:hypothetical protein